MLGRHPVYWYKLTKTNRVVIACDEEGVMILNNDLTKIHSFTGLTGVWYMFKKRLNCTSAMFDSSDNLIIGDHDNREIYILDRKQYNLIQKLSIKDMSNPARFKLYQDILWVQSLNPSKVMCIQMKWTHNITLSASCWIICDCELKLTHNWTIGDCE